MAFYSQFIVGRWRFYLISPLGIRDTFVFVRSDSTRKKEKRKGGLKQYISP